MATPINTLDLARELRAAGLTIKASEAIAQVLSRTSNQLRDELVNRDFLSSQLAELETRIIERIAKGESSLKSWLVTTVLGTNLLLIGR